MKKISELLLGISVVDSVGNVETRVSSMCLDSRRISNGSLFVAIKGVKEDGNKYIEEAIKNGAVAIVCEDVCNNKNEDIIYIQVKNSRQAVAIMANNFYSNPSQKLKLVGVTGTNGKTTIATLLFKLFREAGFHCALISTIENKIDEKIYEASQTTPNPVAIASLLAQAVSQGCTHAFMECSSHAIDQERIGGLQFAGGIFTNLTLDHLDYHKTLDQYAEAKKQFFDDLPETAFAISNGDDCRGKYMLRDTTAKKYLYSINSNMETDFGGKTMTKSLDGQTIMVNGKEIKTKLIGKFNAYNILAIYAIAILLGISEEKVISIILNLTAPTGRLEFIKSPSGVYGVVDYAHTPDALQNVLETLKETLTENNKIITIVGCGGERDVTKREVMGRIACSLSDYVVFSSDNPRSEDPENILNDIVKNLTDKNFECEVDRKKAIAIACSKTGPNDIILLAGKGHEQYQVLNGHQIHFSDMEELIGNFKM